MTTNALHTRPGGMNDDASIVVRGLTKRF